MTIDIKKLREELEKNQWQLVTAELVLELITITEMNIRDMIYWRERCNYLENKLRELGCVVKP